MDIPDSFSLEIEELTDGRIIRPVGTIYHLVAKTISQMTDIELRNHIAELRLRVKEAELTVEQKRVHLTHALGELEDREDKIRRHLRNIRVTPSAIKILVPVNGSMSAAFGNIVTKWKTQGKSPEEINDILEKMKRLLMAGQGRANQ